MINHELRSKGLGGTDIAAICGVHPYRTALDVYLDKRGLVERWEGNEATRWGLALEPVIAAEYAEREGVTLEECGTMAHPARAWQVGTPDRLVVGAPVGVEIKTAGLRQAHRWGEPGTDEAPEEYVIQCAWYLSLTDRERWDLVPLIGGQEMRLYHIHRCKDLEAVLLEQGERFWADHVLAGVPPEPGARDVKAISSLFHQKTGDIIEPESAHFELASEYAAALRQLTELEARRDELKARLCSEIGEAKGLRGIATWGETKGRSTFDHKAAVKSGAIPHQVVEQFTRQGAPFRTFRFTFKEE